MAIYVTIDHPKSGVQTYGIVQDGVVYVHFSEYDPLLQLKGLLMAYIDGESITESDGRSYVPIDSFKKILPPRGWPLLDKLKLIIHTRAREYAD